MDWSICNRRNIYLSSKQKILLEKLIIVYLIKEKFINIFFEEVPKQKINILKNSRKAQNGNHIHIKTFANYCQVLNIWGKFLRLSLWHQKLFFLFQKKLGSWNQINQTLFFPRDEENAKIQPVWPSSPEQFFKKKGTKSGRRSLFDHTWNFEIVWKKLFYQ